MHEMMKENIKLNRKVITSNNSRNATLQKDYSSNNLGFLKLFIKPRSAQYMFHVELHTCPHNIPNKFNISLVPPKSFVRDVYA